jgi:hypothetical protein
MDHVLVPGPAFPEGKSFLSPRASEALKKLAEKFKAWEKKKPKKTQIAVYGHADKDEKDAKALSERRAQSAYAFITNDADTWEKLYTVEKWGLIALQELLKDQGHYKGTPDGRDTPASQEAFKAFRKKAKLPETADDAAMRKALFLAYMQGKHDVKIEAERFLKVAGSPTMGCAAMNRIKVSEASQPENRRVAFVLLRISKYFPHYFPCREGEVAPCQGQAKRKGERSGPGIGCMFYDELIHEETQEFCEAEPNQVAEPITYEEAQKIAFEVTACFETPNLDYGTLAGDFDDQGISFGMMQWNIGKGTLQQLLLQFENEDKTLFESCFGNSKEDLEAIRKVMDEKGEPDTHGKGRTFPDGLKWAREQVQSGDSRAPIWLGSWKSYFQKLGGEEKFKAVQRREGLAHNKKPTEGKIDWLRKKNPSAWAKIPLRCYCALWDLSNQYRFTADEIDDIERAWANGIPATAERMTEDFCKIVVDTRPLPKNLDKTSVYARRQGILYAGLCDSDVTAGYPAPSHRKKADTLLEKERFIQDYPGV